MIFKQRYIKMANVAPSIANILAGAELAVGAVSGWAVIATGIIVVGGIFLMAKVGEKINELERTKAQRDQYHVCCCNKVGPSGKYMCHNFYFDSRKKAEEAARHFQNANGTELHYHDTHGSNPHFHPLRNNAKIPGYHFYFPK